jgi:hypothetical protein
LGFTSLEDCCDPLYLWVISRDLKIAKQLAAKSISVEREVPLLGGDISRWRAKRWWQEDRAG